MNKINYDKHDWIDGEPITEALFDNIESGIGRATSSTNLLVDRTNQEEEDLSTTEGKIEHQDMEFDIAIGEHDTLDERLKADVSRFVEVWSGGNYMPFEGKNIRIDNSKVGWIRDLKISGETYQDPNNLSDIQSAGDLVDGRYKIEILSHNKNLINRQSINYNVQNANFTEHNCNIITNGNNFRYTYKYEILSIDKEQDSFVSNLAGSLLNSPNLINADIDTSLINQKLYTGAKGTVSIYVNNAQDKYSIMSLRAIRTREPVNMEFRIYDIGFYLNDKVDNGYIPYKEDKKEILIDLDGGLKSLPDGTSDTIEQREDGVYLVQRVGKVTYTEGDENLDNCITDNTVSYKAKTTPIETKLDLDMSKWLTYQDVTYFTTTCNVQPTLSLKAPVDINAVVSELQTANYSLRRNNQQLEQENQQAEKELNVLQEQHDQQTADLLDMDMRVLILEE